MSIYPKPHINIRQALTLVLPALLIVVFYSAASALGTVDPNYKGITSGPGDLGVVMHPQPDGKFYVNGAFDVVNGEMKGRLVRLNADQTVDSSFNCSVCMLGATSPLVLPDGKLFVGALAADGFYKLYRLNSDGSVDGTYSSAFSLMSINTSPIGLMADGRLYVMLFAGLSSEINRLNADGSKDNSFTPVAASGGFQDVFRQVDVLPDGKLMVAGRHHILGPLFVLNTDGTKDTSFSSPILTSPFIGPPTIEHFNREPSGAISFNGLFNSVNGVGTTTTGLARLNPNASVDQKFAPAPPLIQTFIPTGMRYLPDGKYIVSGVFPDLKKFVRLNHNGSLDDTYTAPIEHANANEWTLDGQGRVIFYGCYYGPDPFENRNRIFRLNLDGTKDDLFTPVKIAGSATVNDAVFQPDGRLVVAGGFFYLNNFNRYQIGRVHPDGATDANFDVVNGFGTPDKLLILPDGKVLASTYYRDGSADKSKIRRYNSDGSFDGLSKETSCVKAVALQSDGKILLGGGSLAIDGFARTGLARLNADGTLDTAFNPLILNPNVSVVIVQADGKIMIGGAFTSVNGVSRTNLARLNADGSLDTGFNAGSLPAVTAMLQQPSGGYLAASVSTVRRLNNDGSADAAFLAPSVNSSGEIKSIVQEAGGAVIAGGSFSTPRKNIFRFNSSGQLDAGFIPEGADGEVVKLLIRTDGKILAAGAFKRIGKTYKAGLALIATSPGFSGAPQFDFDGDGRSDLGVFRGSDANWYLAQSANGFLVYHFGLNGDVIAPADYDGDGKSDFAIYRNGQWWYVNSTNNSMALVDWGGAGDVPMPSDFDGDGKADFIYYRLATGQWFRKGSMGGVSNVQFGTAGDVPATGDFDGDGKTDPAIFRPSSGTWWYLPSTTGIATPVQWGLKGDVPVTGDYDGDGKTDLAVWRPSNGAWYILNSSNNSVFIFSWGLSDDRPVAADYDGDGKTDIAVYRPSNGVWFIMQSTAGFTGMQYGLSTDKPLPNAFIY